MTPAFEVPDGQSGVTPGYDPARAVRRSARVGRLLAPFTSAIAVFALSVMLVVTIYYTLLDVAWVAFLLGVLFSSVLAIVAQSIRAQWRLAQRTAELEHERELRAEEIARGERLTQGLRSADARFRTVLDGVPAMVFFVDREERCRFSNEAFEQWCGVPESDVSGTTLKELVDPAVYEDLKARGAQALVGSEAQFEACWPAADGAVNVKVKLTPYPAGAQAASGYYAYVSPPLTGQSRATSSRAPAPGVAAPDAAHAAAGNAAYLEAMERQVAPHGNSRERLMRAIEEDRFILLEQRIEPLTSEGQSNLREVLLRLQDEDESTLPPGGFFEIAERYDLMAAIDRWVIRKLLRSCATQRSADKAWRMPLYCLNVSAATLRDRSFANHVRAQLAHWEIPGNRLCFEIDHGTLAGQAGDIAALMEQLKPLGCQFTVDGFGSHKVSFSPFQELRFDYLKIDGAIVSEVLRSSAELTKVKAIVLACRKIGVHTIAQFVEDDAARAKLKDAGVDYVQGFGIARPGPLGVVAAPVAIAQSA